MRHFHVRFPVPSSLLALALAGCGGGGHHHGANASHLFSGGATVAIGASTTLTDVALADLNGDGRADLIVTSSDSGNASVALGEQLGGAGHFGAPTTVAVTGSLTAVATGDFDQDGDVDAAVTDATGTRVVVLTNSGDGTLSVTNSISLAAGTDPSDLAVLDINGDGHLDLVVADRGTSDLSLALGGAGGTFGAATTIALDASFAGSTLATGDFDRDGRLDVAVGSSANGSVEILLGDGLGGVAFTQTVVVDAGEEITGLATGDFDEDGDVDLAVVESGEGDVYFLRNDGTGDFLLEGEFETDVGASGLVAADFDLDGHLDVAVGVGNRVGVLLGNGDATLDAVLTFPASGNTAVSIATADLDCDGSSDLVNANSVSGNVGVLLGVDHSISTSASSATEATLVSGTIASDVATADVDGDGDLDLLVADRASGSLEVALGNGDGTFGTAVALSAGAGVEATGLAVADVDGDGDLDVAVSLGTGDGVAILTNAGNGSFSLFTTVSTGLLSNPLGVALADVDRNGTIDVVTTATGSLSLALGNGNGTFAAATGIGLSPGMQSDAIAVGDFDSDGRLDLAVASAVGTVDVLLGTGPGTFGSPTSIVLNVGATLSDLVAVDLDCDGDLDLAVVDRTAGRVRVLLGDGSGAFASGGSFVATAGATALVAGDVDRDGDVDLAVTSETTGTVVVLVNDGDAVFTTSAGLTFATTASGAAALAAGDLDHDGKLDVVTANSTEASASVLLNDGN